MPKGLAAGAEFAGKFTHSEARDRVTRGADVLELDAWFAARREEHAHLLGFHYCGSETRWREVVIHLAAVRSILEDERGLPPPQALAEALLVGGEALRRIGDLGRGMAVNIQALDLSLPILEKYIDLQALAGLGPISECHLSRLHACLNETHDQIAQFQAGIKILTADLRNGHARDAECMAQDAAGAREVQEIEQEYAVRRELLEQSYGHLFSGADTDWNRVSSDLEWTEQLLRHLEMESWKSACAEAACSVERVNSARGILKELEPIVSRIPGEQEFHRDVFDESALRLGGKAICLASFFDLTAWLDSKIENIGKLSEWVQFRETREECTETGIDEFLDCAIEMRLPAPSLEGAFRKRLLMIQLDAIYDQVPQLRTFQWQDHEQLVREFQKLDRELMGTYANVVQAIVIDRQPSLDGPAAGQVGFLRKQLAKQRKHAPLRKLFQESGEIILDLTPCLLMSPLSVATFLPKDAVRFDVVIFDEASQVPSEEATGAIMRAKQLIVAGDTKQLPPTRFFERSHDDEDQDDDGAQDPLDSLLEDCDASGMQSCRLLWHYRSKHEDLISFSNAEFYGNDLTTFPAPNTQARMGIGVHLEHVPDGVYDRGHSRTNRREARRVAELVGRHCDTWGVKRSIGVIALSTAQETAINEEMERLLIDRPDLEVLLKSGSEEAFFVKPLENVQGDERDTIIISIGYGKDAAGLLSLNFGPINFQGGEKRLNVAVTRARWELVVVSSILAHDIDESRVQSIGPKLLRRYLAFAVEGRLPVETTAPTGESESPFEVAVWQALQARGINVDRQVGSSRYRIDMAIKDSERPGRYLLGVECDGATYHSSAVARDRDRLRQQVLEGLGWKIHRIWSTDWLRDQKGCLLRLLQRIEELKGLPEQVAPTPLRIEEVPRESFTAESNGQGEAILNDGAQADPYDGNPEIGNFCETPPKFRRKEEFYVNDAMVEADILNIVQREGPIHEELLVRRVARTFQLMRTGHQVESRISAQIKVACRKHKTYQKGKFVWIEGIESVAPRRPTSGGKLRDIEHVPPEELESASLLVVRLTHGITESELAGETARVLGYLRITDNIRSMALKTVKKLHKSGALVLRGEQLFIPFE